MCPRMNKNLCCILNTNRGSNLYRLLPKPSYSLSFMGDDAFSEMPGGRPSSFHGVTEWGTPWLPLVRAGEQGGGRDHPSVTP